MAMAQGQATTMTANATSPPLATPATPHQITPDPTARINTTGMNSVAARSARRSTGAMTCRAVATSSTICRSTVSPPTRSAHMMSPPWPLTTPASTASPAPQTRGRGSPVNSASWMSVRPSITRPSAGIRSPGRIRNVSPTRRSASATSCSPSASTRNAARGSNPSRPWIRSRAWDFAVASMSRPNVTSTGNMVAVSKYTWPVPRITLTALTPKAVKAPAAINVSRLGRRRASSPAAPTSNG